MIIFSFHKRYSHTDIKYKYGKDQSTGFVCEADTASGEWYKYGRVHFLHQRCHAVLLKSQGLSSPQIALKVDLCQQSINKWVDRFLTDGINGLENRPGQGAKSVISREADRQSVKAASEETFRRFLSVLVQDMDA
jgi:hypothetical protein